MPDIATKTIRCSGELPAFLALPNTQKKSPAIVLMHERYGLVQHTRDLAQRFAHDGFVCIAPDFFYKHPDQEALHRGAVGYDMTDPEAVLNLKAAVSELARLPQVDSDKIAVMGVCHTGRHPLVLAAEHPISAAVVWYGAASKREWEVNGLQPKALEEIIAAIDCPVFGAFGETDHIISLADVQRLRNCLEAHRKSYDIHVYEGAPHGWLNDTMPGRYRKAAAQAGWAAQQRFLTEVLGGGYQGGTVRWSFACESGRDYDFSKNVRLE